MRAVVRSRPQSLAAVAVSAFALLVSSCGGSYRDVPVAAPPVAAPARPEPRVQPPTPPPILPVPASEAIVPSPGRPRLPKPAPVRGGSGELEPGVYVSAGGQRLPFQLLTPTTLDSGVRYPLVVFLHGASASGTDNQRQISGTGAIGLAPWIDAETQRRHPSFVLAPQAAPKGSNWVRRWELDPNEDRAEREPLELVIELVDELARIQPIDPGRIYITGLSMGGFGTWIAISRHPGRFAAAVPVCGGGNPGSIAKTRAAVWAFHGDADRVVPVRRSRQMIGALRKAGRLPRYTEYAGVRHDSWTRAFGEPGLVEWLFSQTLGGPRAAANVADAAGLSRAP